MPSSEQGLDPTFLRKTTDDLIKALTSPAYVAAVQAVRDAPEESRLVEASHRLTPDGLRNLGVPIPSDMRITSRYFETGFPNAIDVELGDPPAGGVNLVNALNEAKPGLLDNLRINNPEIFQALIAQSNEALGKGVHARIGYCNCGGHTFSGPLVNGTVCGGAGAHLA
jgi:hypothetical protein